MDRTRKKIKEKAESQTGRAVGRAAAGIEDSLIITQIKRELILDKVEWELLRDKEVVS